MAETTREKILLCAQELVQTKGYNGFSFRNLADAVGIKASSIHYYFPSKQSLIHALVDYYKENLSISLGSIGQKYRNDYKAQLRGVSEIFASNILNDNKLCLCSMIAHELNSLPESVHSSLQMAFNTLEIWLTDLLESGQKGGHFRLSLESQDMARVLISAWEGATMLAKVYHDPDRIYQVEQLVSI